MVEENRDPTGLVFHYTTKEFALEHILHKRLLKMGEYSKTKDPKESKAWSDFTFDLSRNSDRWSDALDAREEIRRVQNCTRILCLTLDSEGDPYQATVEKRGFGLSRMWAQYAGGHTGVCLGFDASLLGQAIKETVPFPRDLLQDQVRYSILSEENPREKVAAFDIDVIRAKELGHSEAMREHVKTHAKNFFFKKAQDWRDEREYRWVYCAKPDDSEILVPIEESLKQVVLGVDFPEAFISLVWNICQQVEAQLNHMQIFRGQLTHSYDTNRPL